MHFAVDWHLIAKINFLCLKLIESLNMDPSHPACLVIWGCVQGHWHVWKPLIQPWKSEAFLLSEKKPKPTLSMSCLVFMCKWKWKVLVTQLTLCDPMDCSPPGSSVHGILRARILEWVTMASSRGSSQLRDRTHLLCFLHLQVGSLPLVPPGNTYI